MPRNLNNWTFDLARKFLGSRGFTLHRIKGSKHIHIGMINGELAMPQLHYHGANESFSPSVMKSIIRQSKIPQEEWINWSEE